MMDFLQALSIGGDLAVIGLVALLLRFDRRILSMELFLKNRFGYGG